MIQKNYESLMSPVRTVKSRVEVFDTSTLLYTFLPEDKLIGFEIDRNAEEGLFFGFGICQSIQIKIADKEKIIDITPKNTIKISYLLDGEWIYPHPDYYVTQSRRDEITNELTIYGYDAIFDTSKHIMNDLTLEVPYTIKQVAESIATLMNVSLEIQRIGETETCFDTSYPEGANVEGTEILRDILNDIAEATQTIYFINHENKLVFKRLDKNIEPEYIITKNDYTSFDSKDGRRLQTIASVTELGDNYSASTVQSGTTQYVRENPFWDIRDDVATLVDNALAAVGDLSIGQTNFIWRGNYLIEIGDKYSIDGRDKTVISFFIGDKLTYNGALSDEVIWEYDDESSETFTNSTNLGETLKQTYAKVDKVNKEITIVAGETEANSNALSSLIINTDSITASVKEIEEVTTTKFDDINEEMVTLTNKVNATMSAEDIKLEIQSELANGVDSVTTSTGFTFNEEGLTVEKAGSEMKTQITEDGMTVYRDNTEVLIANNVGVQAINLQARTYLIIGTNSRFEDYDNNSRTGCFWIGS